jgi:hypothetical protein
MVGTLLGMMLEKITKKDCSEGRANDERLKVKSKN